MSGVQRKPPFASCHPDKPNFHKQYCRQCYNKRPEAVAWRLQHYQENKERIRANYRRHYYKYHAENKEKSRYKNRRHFSADITNEDFAEMVRRQNGLCYICRTSPASMLDHNHTTGQIRKVLCRNCNWALGQMHDNPTVLRAAADYLEEHGT